MAITFDEINALQNGARFVRADLHTHSIASHDVDPASGMSVEAIIEAAVAANVQLLSITDHNTISALPQALAYAQRHSDKLLLIPGVELSTPQGHLLVYFSPSELPQLEKFFVPLEIIKDDKGSRTVSSMLDLVRAAYARGGVSIAAHIDTATGFEIRNPGYPGWKKDLIMDPGLVGLEFRDAENRLWYSQDESGTGVEPTERRRYAAARSEAGVRPYGAIARLQSSDAHELAHLSPPRALTRIKLTELTWESFRNALADPDARITIDEIVPPSIPRIIGLSITGGYLDGTAVKFSQNLNVFFGGRGTGKSTAVKALAFALGFGGEAESVPPFQSVSVFCQDANEIPYRFTRNAGGDVVGRIRKDGGLTPVGVDAFPIEFFGQGELGRVAQDSLLDPRSLQQFLDRHISFDGLLDDESATEAEARELARQLAPLIVTLDSRRPLDDELKSLEARLKESEESRIKQVAEYQNRLTAERSLRGSFGALAAQYRKGISLRNLVSEPKQLRDLSKVIAYGKSTESAFEIAETEIESINDFLVAKAREINERMASAAAKIEIQLGVVDSQHAKSDDQVQQFVEQLKDKGLASSIAELNEWSKRKTVLVSQIARIDAQRTQHDELVARFEEKFDELRAIRAKIMDRRKLQIADLNNGFNRAGFRHDVFIVRTRGAIPPEMESFLQVRLTGSYYQDESIAALCRTTDPGVLADLLRARDADGLAALPQVGQKWTQVFIEKLGDPEAVLFLRTLWNPLAPRFKVTDRTTKKEIDFKVLSDGQKHTIMLTIALMSGSRYPLVIDQPEDDLDNKFIAERVVKTLRDVKERRQVILVTHNANIAVLGDSEQLLAMEHVDDGGRVASRGSIDDAETKRAVQDSLEGGAQASQDALRCLWIAVAAHVCQADCAFKGQVITRAAEIRTPAKVRPEQLLAAP